MRHLTDVEIERIKILTENSVEISLIEPTETGLHKKFILDATGPVRSYLKSKNIHDYASQKQGPENKAQIKSFLIDESKIVPSVASLYRPRSKKGDPRIWFKGLPGYAKPNDIIGILAKEDALYLINITRLDIGKLLNQKVLNPLQDIVKDVRILSNEIADELLSKLRHIAKRGPIKALLNADTSVGRTLESLLGIKPNSSKKPDYKGIELKSYRDRRKNRKNLFGQVPEWDLSSFKSSSQILDAFGYWRGEDFKLYCTVSTKVRNSQGLILKVNDKINQLIENSDREEIKDFAVWQLELLHKRLLEKHNETFWIAANSQLINGDEHFIYTKAEHTKKPIVPQFDILLTQGLITVDHLIKKEITGSVTEKGPLFKLKPDSLNLLFPPSKLYNLL
jgi:hypothetical protein